MQIITRMYDTLLAEHLAKQRRMAFISGPRQVGKTTTCRIHGDAYINWDNIDDRETILAGPATLVDKFRLDRLSGTNAVPAKIIYWTDGSTRAIPVGNRTVYLKHVRPGLIRWAHHAAAPVVSAMMWLGPTLAADSSMLDRLSQRLPIAVIKDLADGLSTLPAWAAPIAREITTPHRIAGDNSVLDDLIDQETGYALGFLA